MPLAFELFLLEMKYLASNHGSCSMLCGMCMRLLLEMAMVPGLPPPPVAQPVGPSKALAG